jgi:hypothetical protein
MGSIGKTWKKFDPVGRMITDKNFAKNWWKHNPMYQAHFMAGKAGFKSPLYLMGEEKRGFGRAIELSGDPFQRMVRGKIRDWAMDSGLAKSAPPKYTSLPKANIPQYQAPDNSGMMNSILAQQQQGDQASSTQKAEALASANAQQQQNINAAMQNSKQNLNNSLMRTPVPSTFSKITPASTNQFKFPNVAGLTFGK